MGQSPERGIRIAIDVSIVPSYLQLFVSGPDVSIMDFKQLTMLFWDLLFAALNVLLLLYPLNFYLSISALPLSHVVRRLLVNCTTEAILTVTQERWHIHRLCGKSRHWTNGR